MLRPDNSVVLHLAKVLNQHLLRDRRYRPLQGAESKHLSAEQVKEDTFSKYLAFSCVLFISSAYRYLPACAIALAETSTEMSATNRRSNDVHPSPAPN